MPTPSPERRIRPAPVNERAGKTPQESQTYAKTFTARQVQGPLTLGTNSLIVTNEALDG